MDIPADSPSTLDSAAPKDPHDSETLLPAPEDHVESDSDDSCLVPFASLLTRRKTGTAVNASEARTKGAAASGSTTPSIVPIETEFAAPTPSTSTAKSTTPHDKESPTPSPRRGSTSDEGDERVSPRRSATGSASSSVESSGDADEAGGRRDGSVVGLPGRGRGGKRHRQNSGGRGGVKNARSRCLRSLFCHFLFLSFYLFVSDRMKFCG